MKAALLVNAKSRRGEWRFGQARELLASGGLEFVQAEGFRKPHELVDAAERHVAAGVPLVVIGGGDGTFNAVAHAFAGASTEIGVLPLGTGNAFARDLGIPTEIGAACRTVLEGRAVSVDMGLVDDHAFVNIASVGLSTRIAQGLNSGSKRWLGQMAYLVAILRGLHKVEPFDVRLELPEGVREFRSLQVVIGNGRFHAGPFLLAPDASISEGHLSIYALAGDRKADFIRLALRLRSGRHGELDQVNTFRVPSGRLVTDPIQRVTVDGELPTKTPIDFRVVPGALRVRVGSGFDQSV